REDLQLFLRLVVSFGRFATQAFPRGLWGLTVLAGAVERLRPMDQGILLMFWQWFRRLGFGPNMDELLAVARQWEAVWLPMFQALQQLSTEVAGMAAVVAPGEIARAVQSKRAMNEMLQTLQRLYGEHREQVDAYLAQHPEINALLAAATLGESTST